MTEKYQDPEEFQKELDGMNPERLESMTIEAKAHFQKLVGDMNPIDAFMFGATHILFTILDEGETAKQKVPFAAKMVKHLMPEIYEKASPTMKATVDWHLS